MEGPVKWDVAVLFIARAVRMFGYGTIGVILALFLSGAGLSDKEIGLLLTLTLLGDSAISLAVTLTADRLGRKLMLVGSSVLMAAAGYVFGLHATAPFWVLLLAATFGVISPSGNEVGPFMALEQSVLSELIRPEQRTHVFAWYNLLGYAMTAVGALVAGHAVQWLHTAHGVGLQDAYKAVFLQYAGLGAVLVVLFMALTRHVEAAAMARRRAAAAAATAAAGSDTQPGAAAADLSVPLLQGSSGNRDEEAPAPQQQQQQEEPAVPALLPGGSSSTKQQQQQEAASGDGHHSGLLRHLGLTRRSLRLVAHLSLLFSLDSFAGGLITGTLLVYYFKVTYGVSTAYLGSLLFVANLIAAVSTLLSGWVANRIGLINTMVFTHLPSNVLVILIPLMPSLELATAMVFLRFSISQMDVAPRQSFVAGVVPPGERTATMGITNIAKSIGAAFGPLLTGYLAAQGRFEWAFFLCGGLKIVYDLALLYSCWHIKPQH